MCQPKFKKPKLKKPFTKVEQLYVDMYVYTHGGGVILLFFVRGFCCHTGCDCCRTSLLEDSAGAYERDHGNVKKNPFSYISRERGRGFGTAAAAAAVLAPPFCAPNVRAGLMHALLADPTPCQPLHLPRRHALPIRRIPSGGTAATEEAAAAAARSSPRKRSTWRGSPSSPSSKPACPRKPRRVRAGT